MRELDFKIYKTLFESKSITRSSIPKGVFESNNFKNLLRAEILTTRTTGRGFKIEVSKDAEFKDFFHSLFPENIDSVSKSDNIKKYRSSKARKVDTKPVFFLRGFSTFLINGRQVNLKDYTSDFGLFSVIPQTIISDRICFVENLESFLNAEKLLGEDYLFAHKYGRIGSNSLKMMQPKEVLVFVDFDFNGLDEYLRIKEVFDYAELYLPTNYDELFEKQSASLNRNKAKMSSAVKKSCDPVVVKIREQVARTNRFLEQEVLIDV
jgi:hypothetical protein